jgi:uncharacterized protein
MAAPSTRLRLRVAPGARGGRHGRIERHGDDAWKVRVAAPPEGGKANDAVLDLLAAQLEIPRASLKLVSGSSGRDKVVELAGLDAVEAARRLEQAS